MAELSPYKLQDIARASDADLVRWLRMRYNATVYQNIHTEAKKRGIV